MTRQDSPEEFLTDRAVQGMMRAIIVTFIPLFVAVLFFLILSKWLPKKFVETAYFCIFPIIFLVLYGWFSRLFFKCSICKRAAFRATLKTKLLGPWGVDWCVNRCHNCGAGFKLFYEPKSALPKDKNDE